MWSSFTALDHSVRTGQSGIRALNRAGFWAYLRSHPGQLAIFDEAMTSRSRADVAAVLAAHDFSRHRSVADIGGGRGHLIAAIVDAHPDTRGVLFDLPQVAVHTDPTPRLDVVAGDFFTDPLPACDAYVLMQVIHDWDDTDAAAILAAVSRAATPSDSTVLLLERLYPEDDRPHPTTGVDVMMLATTGGRERTTSQYRALLHQAEIELVAIRRTPGPLSILEGRVRR